MQCLEFEIPDAVHCFALDLLDSSGRWFCFFVTQVPKRYVDTNSMVVREEMQNMMGATIQLLWELWMYPKERNRAKLSEFEQANTVIVIVTV